MSRSKRGAALQALKNITGSGKGKQPELDPEKSPGRSTKRSRTQWKPENDSTEHTLDEPDLFITELHTCFICNKQLVGDSDYINAHIDRCLENEEHLENNGFSAGPLELENGSGGAGEFAEYTWMGETRVRATSLFGGSLAGAGFSPVKKNDDVDEDLNIDEDDEQIYGQPQYSERDIIRSDSEVNEHEAALRRMVAGVGDTKRKGPLRSQKSDIKTLEVDSYVDVTVPELPYDPKILIESLKTRIRQLEMATKGMIRCLICLEPYDTPVTSIVCWHVHCERCWLQSLGAKKLCPQCQKITSTNDLRRVYL